MLPARRGWQSRCFSQGHRPGGGQRICSRRNFPDMKPSMFNLRVPLEARDDVFLMNTLTDAQLVVSRDVVALLDRAADEDIEESNASSEELEAIGLLRENGF